MRPAAADGSLGDQLQDGIGRPRGLLADLLHGVVSHFLFLRFLTWLVEPVPELRLPLRLVLSSCPIGRAELAGHVEVADHVLLGDVVLRHQRARQLQSRRDGLRRGRIRPVALRVAQLDADAVRVPADVVERPAARLRAGWVLSAADRPGSMQVRHALVDAVRVHEVVRAAFHHGRGVISGVVLRGIAVVARVVNDNVLDGPCVPCRAIIPCVGVQLLNFHPCPPH